MYCKYCGTKLEDGVHFCPQCGQSVEDKPENTGPTPTSPPTAKPKMALWKKIALGAVAFIVLVIGLALFATSGLIDPVDRHIAALGKGDLQAAYEETSQSFRESTSLEDFTRFVEANPILTKITGHSFSQRKVENNIGYLSGELTTSTGAVQPVEFRLVKENDEWKILGISFNPKSDE